MTTSQGTLPPAVSVTALRKVYGQRVAVDALSLAVPAGTVCALLGPNGAGKTTTLECVAGFRRPDAGSVRVLGHDPAGERDAVNAVLGVMLQEGGAYPAATPAELLALHASFYPRPLDAPALLQRLGLTEAAGQRYRSLSGGQKRLVSLALALVGRPRVALLDEPTAGLDPQARLGVWEYVTELRRDGVTVLLATHLLDEAERLADLVAVIDRGRLLAFDSPVALTSGAQPRLVVTTPAAFDPGALAAAVGAPVVRDGPGRYVVAAGAETLPAVTAWFVAQDLPLTGVTAASDGLEEVFLRLTGAGTP